jgi:ribosome-associated toxin RatA of RatAB toxin-antitoxin module
MTIIKRSALVPHSVRQMFELVNSIEDYPRFLEWCHSSEIISRTETMVEASLDIAWSGMHKSFTTRNILHPYTGIDLILVSGPFNRLEGKWSFAPLEGDACKVSLDLEIDFKGGLIDRLFQPIFNHIANSLVDAFCKRAAEIYGER